MFERTSTYFKKRFINYLEFEVTEKEGDGDFYDLFIISPNG